MISGLSNASPAPETNYCLSLETPGYLAKSRNIPGTSNRYYFYESQTCGTPHFGQCWKRRAPTNDEYPSENVGNLKYEINIYQK